MLKLAKAEVVRLYHAKNAELELYWRMESFRAKGMRPIVVLGEKIGGSAADNSSEYLHAELFAPRSNMGGILRLEFRRYIGEELAQAPQSSLHEWESFRRDEHASEELRSLASKLELALFRKLHPTVEEPAVEEEEAQVIEL
jgi:hypothetical protein